MTPEQFAAILVALAAVLGAIARCIAEVRSYHHAVNSKMDALLRLTATSEHAKGLLQGQTEAGAPPGSPGHGHPFWSGVYRRGHN